KLVDTLDACREKPLRFLRYYIMAHHEIDYHRGLREDEIYDWFVKHSTECGIEADPLGFLEDLIECARAHASFLTSNDAQGNENRYLRNLSFLGGALRQQYILLLAGRNLAPELFDTLCRAIENLFFCYIITREPTKTFERNFARWSSDLRAVKDEKGLDAFICKYLVQDMANRAERFDFAFRELSQDRIQLYRIRYILAKLTQFIEEQAWGNPAHGRLDHYITKKVEIEHILPTRPRPDVRAAFDKADEYNMHLGRLGNLTLLEKTINGSVSNGSFADKANGYTQSSFLLTKSLVESPKVGSNTQLNRAVEQLIQFDKWDSSSIQKRQEMLAALASKVWDMPVRDEDASGIKETDSTNVSSDSQCVGADE
ncbi:MAG: HNH endonuclease family protein, partial [Myxococcota bacterium]